MHTLTGNSNPRLGREATLGEQSAQTARPHDRQWCCRLSASSLTPLLTSAERFQKNALPHSSQLFDSRHSGVSRRGRARFHTPTIPSSPEDTMRGGDVGTYLTAITRCLTSWVKNPWNQVKSSFTFQGLLFFNSTFGAFLAFSSLGSGSSTRTQKQLDAHQERISIAMKERLFLFYTLNHEPFIVSCVGKCDVIRLLHQCIICVISLLSFLLSTLLKETRRSWPQIRELISEHKTKKIFKREDRLQVHWTRAKQ